MLCLFFSRPICFFFFNDTATTEIYTLLYTLSLHDALPISRRRLLRGRVVRRGPRRLPRRRSRARRAAAGAAGPARPGDRRETRARRREGRHGRSRAVRRAGAGPARAGGRRGP